MSRLWSCFVGCDSGAETFDEIKSHLSMVAVFIELFNDAPTETEIQTSVFQMLYQLICAYIFPIFMHSQTHLCSAAQSAPSQNHIRVFTWTAMR